MMKKSLLCLAVVAAGSADASTLEKAQDLQSATPFVPKVLSMRQLSNGSTEAVIGLNAPQQGPARTEEESTMTFSYAYEPYTSLSFNSLASGTTVYQAIYIPESLTTMFDGCKVTGFTFYSGSQSNVTSATVFFADQKSKVYSSPLYSETFTGLPTTDFTKIDLTLETPFEISADQPFYVGYSAQPTKGYYIVVDGMSSLASDETCMIGTRTKTGTTVSWQNAVDYGSLCIALTLQGDLPHNGLGLFSYDVPQSVEVGEDFATTLIVTNKVAGDISSFGYEYQVADEAPVSGTFEMPEGFVISQGQMASVKLEGLKCNTFGYQLPFSFKITTVNGEPNFVTDAEFETTINGMNPGDGFASHVLIEEGTGTWCGWCPLGITMMEMAKEIDPEFFHCVALHSGDNMEVSSFSLMSSYFSSFPSAMINRGPVTHPANIIPDLEPLYESLSAQKVYAGITDMNVKLKDNGSIDVTTDVKFAFDFGSSNIFRLGLYITEDGMGPYFQSNNYAGSTDYCYGWEDKGSRVKMTFDDVAREIVGGANGITSSIPTTIEAGETYTYTKNMSLSNVTSEQFNVIAYIINRKTKTVVNSLMVAFDKTVSVSDVEAEAVAKVYGAEGAVVVDGEFAVANVFNMAGQKVAQASASGSISLPAGIYVVNVDGKATKVVVK